MNLELNENLYINNNQLKNLLNQSDKTELINYIDTAISNLKKITVTASNSITYIKIGHFVIMNGQFVANNSSGTFTLPYKSKHSFGFGFIGYYPINGNIQGYGYAVVSANSKTVTYKCSSAFTNAPLSAIYYTDE